VITSSVRLSLLVLGAALATSVGHGQPRNQTPVAGLRPYYTAFPDIKPTRLHTVVKNADGTERVAVEAAKEVPLPRLPTVAADAPLLRKVRSEQLQEGLAYLKRVKANAQLGAEDPADVRTAAAVAGEVCLIAAELEDDAAKRVAWYEARVRLLKEGEESVHYYVLEGNLPTTALHGARFERLGAEADLLKLKAEVEKAKK
jgi:hypothetical protein